LLDLACVRYIFVNNPDADPQWLTEHKMAMVSNRFLGACSVLLGFHNKIRKVGQQLDIAIADYMVEILEARERNSAPNFWSDLSLSAPPSKSLKKKNLNPL
jgi:endoribonuclease Dicer